MKNTITRKSLSYVVVFALIIAMFAGLGGTATAAAGDPYVVTGTMSQLSNNPSLGISGTVWSISNETEMRDLIPYINSGSNSTGVTFFLTTDITLTAPWTPVGNGANHAFNGKFDGSNNDPLNIHTVSGMDVEYLQGTDSYHGLFGYSTGPIVNVEVIGNITIVDPSVQYVGGIVGYTTNDVYNCHTTVTIDAPNVTHVGGVVGAIENTATVPILAPFHVQACSASGNIIAGTRTGGVVGAAYCNSAGNVVVDNCYFSNGGDPTALQLTTTTGSRAWDGGVVGYCKGYISNCYAVASLESINEGHYICGIVGILNSRTAPQATLSNSYAAVAFDATHDDPGYDRPLYGSADDSNTLPISNSLYDAELAGDFYNDPGDGTSGWGYWYQSGSGSTQEMKTNTALDNVFTGSTKINPGPTPLAVLGSAFAEDDTRPFVNGGYPFLVWQETPSELPPYIPGDGTLNPPSETGIFLDGVNGSDSNSGTDRDHPVKTVGRALAVKTPQLPNIYVINTVALTGDELDLINTQYNNTHFIRSAAFAGVLFTVPSEVNSNLSAVLIDGNRLNVSAAFSLFNVTGGNLTVGTDAVLESNVSSDGGAINVSSGSATVTLGQISNNSAVRGGAVYVVEGGSFTLNGADGSINTNTAQNNGGAITSRGTVHIIDGEIRSNTVSSSGTGSGAYGGALAVMDGSATINGGSIVNNSVVSGNNGKAYGGAVYTESSGTVVMSGGLMRYNSAFSSSSGSEHGTAYGGGIAYMNGHATISGGTIVGNSAGVTGTGGIANGGGVYIAPGLTLNLNGGTISNNAAMLGQGIYADFSNTSGNTYIVLNPTGSSVITVSDIVYLVTGAITTQSGAQFSIPNPLPGSSISTPFSVQVDYPGQIVLVAFAGNSDIARDSVQYFETWLGDPMIQIANAIFYNSLDLVN